MARAFPAGLVAKSTCENGENAQDESQPGGDVHFSTWISHRWKLPSPDTTVAHFPTLKNCTIRRQRLHSTPSFTWHSSPLSRFSRFSRFASTFLLMHEFRSTDCTCWKPLDGYSEQSEPPLTADETILMCVVLFCYGRQLFCKSGPRCSTGVRGLSHANCDGKQLAIRYFKCQMCAI